jgi:hypothetical protein
VLPRAAAALLVVAAAGLTALLLPSTARFWLQDMGGTLPGLTLIVGATIAGIVGYFLHPLLPRRSGTAIERRLLPVIYATAVALGSALIALVLFFVLARLGLGAGSGLLVGDELHLGAARPPQGMALMLQVLSQSLVYGAAWGLALTLLTNLIESRR